MKAFDHPNVMSLTGICWTKDTDQKSPRSAPLIVLPFMEFGDLKNYLKKYRLEKMARQVFCLFWVVFDYT